MTMIFWERLKESFRRAYLLPLWDVVTLLLSLVVYTVLGIMYEASHPLVVYTREPPTRVGVYLMGQLPLIGGASLLGVLLLIVGESFLRYIKLIITSYKRSKTNK